MTKQASDNYKPNLLAELILRLRTHPLIALLLAGLLIIAGFISLQIYDHLITDNHREAFQQRVESIAATQTARVNSYIKHQQQRLSTIVNNKQVINALIQGDDAVLTGIENRLQPQNKSQTLYLLKPGRKKLDGSNNFAARELASRAFAGETPNPEAVRLQKGWRLLFVSPIKDDNNTTIGVALNSISTKALIKNLQPESSHGQTLLYQKLPGLQGNAVISTGLKMKDLQPAKKTTLLPYWQIHFTGNQQLLKNKAPLTSDVIAILSCLAVAILLLLYLFLRTVLTHYKNEPLTPPEKALLPTEESLPELAESSSYLQVIPSAGPQADPSSDKEAHSDEPSSDGEPPAQTKDDRLLYYYPETIFRDYDIRGIYGQQINADFAHRLGCCLGTMAQEQDETSLVLGWDGRLSSPELKAALQEGILSSGCNVLSIGAVPTPLLTFALTQISETSSGVMVTASHNLAADNGFKIFFKQHALCGEEVTALRDAMIKGDFKTGKGQIEELNLTGEYTEAIVKDIVPAMNLTVVVDAGNGIAGKFAIDALEGIGCEVIPLYCDVNGNFPHHPPDTAVEEYLQDLIEAVTATRAQLGICLDGDGDRMVAITADGKIVWPDELMMIFARDVLSRHPGSDIVYDIKCTRRLSPLIRSYGGRPVMWKTGHSHMRNKIMECNAPLGGEFSGHLFFRDRWHGSDDGIYAAARLIEVMMVREQSLAGILYGYEKSFSTPEIKIIVPDEKKFDLVKSVIENTDFGDAQLTTFDGLRVDFPTAWGLIRASNTSPALTLRFEAESEESLDKIQSLFRQQLSSIDGSLTF